MSSSGGSTEQMSERGIAGVNEADDGGGEGGGVQGSTEMPSRSEETMRSMSKGERWRHFGAAKHMDECCLIRVARKAAPVTGGDRSGVATAVKS